MRRWLLRPLVNALAIACAVFGVVTLLERLGALERWELQVYDMMLRQRHDPKANDPRIVIVGIDEEDIHWKDYPLRDGLLAQLLEKVLAAEPCAVGLDLYRDLPEPRDGSERKPLLMSSPRRKTSSQSSIFRARIWYHRRRNFGTAPITPASTMLFPRIRGAWCAAWCSPRASMAGNTGFRFR